jgi:hypothetical protein
MADALAANLTSTRPVLLSRRARAMATMPSR